MRESPDPANPDASERGGVPPHGLRMDAEQLRGFRQRQQVHPGEGDTRAALPRKLELHRLVVEIAQGHSSLLSVGVFGFLAVSRRLSVRSIR
jgi:hypothetical protein